MNERRGGLRMSSNHTTSARNYTSNGKRGQQ